MLGDCPELSGFYHSGHTLGGGLLQRGFGLIVGVEQSTCFSHASSEMTDHVGSLKTRNRFNVLQSCSAFAEFSTEEAGIL